MNECFEKFSQNSSKVKKFCQSPAHAKVAQFTPSRRLVSRYFSGSCVTSRSVQKKKKEINYPASPDKGPVKGILSTAMPRCFTGISRRSAGRGFSWPVQQTLSQLMSRIRNFDEYKVAKINRYQWKELLKITTSAIFAWQNAKNSRNNEILQTFVC